jgi:hypothetical protein
VTFSPSNASFVKEGQPYFLSTTSSSEVCSSWDFFDPNVASHVLDDSQSICIRNLEDCIHGDEKDSASSIGNTSPAVQMQEQLGTYGSKEVHDNLNFHKLNHTDFSKIEIADVHLPNLNIEKGPDQVQKQCVEGQNPNSISNNRENEAHHVDKVNVPKGSCSEDDKGSSITSRSKDFLSDVKELLETGFRPATTSFSM